MDLNYYSFLNIYIVGTTTKLFPKKYLLLVHFLYKNTNIPLNSQYNIFL